jgi:hypothetical protein
MNIIEKFKLNRAIKKANKRYANTGYHHLVLFYKGNYIVKSRAELKQLVKNKYFQKGFSIHHIEKIALYTTSHRLH